MSDETPAEIALRRAAKQTRKDEKKKQIVAFAVESLGCTKQQAKVLRKVSSKYFKLADDGLRFRGAGDKLVPVTSAQCTEFLTKKFDFMISKSTTVDGPNAMAALVEEARTNLTARGRLLVSLNGNEKAMNALLTEKPAAVEKKTEDRARGEGGKFVGDKSEKNPWRAGQWHLTEQMRIFKQDPKLAERLAAKAGVHVGAARPAKEAS